LTGISRGDHQAFTPGVDQERATSRSTTMTPSETTVIEPTRIPAWIRPLLRHAVALLLALSGPALMVAALLAGLIAGSPALGGLGLLGGALLTACGGVGLLWSLGRRHDG
jgi:hypothetical protein